MSQPHKFTEYSEFLPKKERRAPLPITNLPVNAISEDTDPTFEIRNLIEQLQQTARDARAQVRIAEQERDGIVEQLARAQQQIEALQETERELRSHFVEVTSLIEARDEALEESERRGQALAEAGRKSDVISRERNDAQRQRDDAFRQRDEMGRKFEAFTRSTEEQARLISETQKQLLTIRQARDAAHAQILDLNTRLGHAEDQIAELEYQRDAAQKAARQAAAEATEFRRQVDIITTDRDATAKQADQLSEELDAQRQSYLDLVEQKSAALQADNEHTAALIEARSQVTGMTQERDAARERSAEVTRELEELRTQFQAFRDEQSKSSETSLNEAHEKVAALETQARESRHEAKNLRQQLDAMNEQLTALQLVAEQAGSKSSNTAEELDAVLRERDSAITSLSAAQKQIDHIIRDRDQVRKLATDNAIELEAQVVALQDELNGIKSSNTSAEEHKEEIAELRQRFEKQRLDTIELSTQFQSAQREIRELSATLAEARLQVKFAQAAARAAQEGRTKSDFASLLTTDTAATEPPAPASTPESTPTGPAAVAVSTEPLTEKEIKSALGAMRHCFQSFTKTPADLSLLNELHCHVESFAERARVSNFLALHRLCVAFSDLTRGLYDTPDHVNPSTLRTVHQTIEFLGALVKEKNLDQVKDPATAQIYAVDDDIGNCECIALAMEESSMRTTYALEPVTALAELSTSRYDLIFLDVNLPAMDGFELCKQIRSLPIHEKTPVVFLTGLATLENRVQSSLSGGNDFIAKPFNLHELSVKAITLLLKNQLQMA